MRSLLTAVLALAAVSAVGCGRSQPWGEVSGTVTLAGKPVFPASVLFSDKERGVEVTADTDASGQFALRTDKLAGLPVGTYRVVVVPLRTDVMPQQGMVFDQAAPPPRPEIPQQVQEIATTQLTAAVQVGDNHFDFELGQIRE